LPWAACAGSGKRIEARTLRVDLDCDQVTDLREYGGNRGLVQSCQIRAGLAPIVKPLSYLSQNGEPLRLGETIEGLHARQARLLVIWL
jgi:hypothetical protein